LREALVRGDRHRHQPLARHVSAGCGSGQAERETAFVASPAIHSSSPISKGKKAREKCCVTGDRAVVLRSSDERGRARSTYRLQKSTSGAWPLEPVSEELADNSGGSSSSARERGRREEASEAGSPAAKPRDRWRALTKQRRAKAPAGEHSSMKGALIREDRLH
jgi:hypothetical protein